MTAEQKRILHYVAQKGSITRMEVEAVYLSLDLFLDLVANFVFERILETTQIKSENKGGRPLMINKYTLTERGKSLLRYYL